MMKTEQLLRQQLDQQFKEWQRVKYRPLPKKGWINLIRSAIGLSTRHLAKRAGVSQGQIVQFEQGELNETITLASLHKLAEAMDCHLVYGLIPKTSLDDIILQQAKKVAKNRVSRVSHSMTLEQQEVDEETQQQRITALTKELVQGPSKKIWAGDE